MPWAGAGLRTLPRPLVPTGVPPHHAQRSHRSSRGLQLRGQGVSPPGQPWTKVGGEDEASVHRPRGSRRTHHVGEREPSTQYVISTKGGGGEAKKAEETQTI